MLRKIIGVVAGYVIMALLIFILFTLLYLVIGADGAFQPGNYQASGTWLVLSFILGLIAAVVGGFVCVLIAKDKKAALACRIGSCSRIDSCNSAIQCFRRRDKQSTGGKC